MPRAVDANNFRNKGHPWFWYSREAVLPRNHGQPEIAFIAKREIRSPPVYSFVFYTLMCVQTGTGEFHNFGQPGCRLDDK
jgi:hypothetical protein